MNIINYHESTHVNTEAASIIAPLAVCLLVKYGMKHLRATTFPKLHSLLLFQFRRQWYKVRCLEILHSNSLIQIGVDDVLETSGYLYNSDNNIVK